MRAGRASWLVIVALVSAVSAADEPRAKLPVIRLGKPDGSLVEVAGLHPDVLKKLAAKPPTADQWALMLGLYVEKNQPRSGERQPALLGTYRVERGLLCFEPRFPLAAGVRYVAVLDFNAFPEAPEIKLPEVRQVLLVPKPKTVPTKVEQVYPTTDVLPENQLKFYLHFSAPMSRGEAYRHIRLRFEDGKVVEDPFLELDEELWDADNRRFTLFFDPGRIKRGLKPREEVGPSLIEGKRYVLEIDPGWTDANGNPLAETFRKSFRVVAPDDNAIDVQTWKITAPAAGTRAPLTVVFPKPLDNALAQRLVWVAGPDGQRVAGTVKLQEKETRWHFTPEVPWAAGTYQLTADTRLEDLAGNSIARPFEVDVFRPVQKEIKTQTVTLPVVVK
jgi:hypothetical protein